MMFVNETAAKETIPKKRFHGLASVKNATKYAAKKINRILGKAKSKIIKPTDKQLADISVLSSTTHLTDVEFYEEEIDGFQMVNFNDISRLSMRAAPLTDNDHDDEDDEDDDDDSYQHIENHHSANESFHSNAQNSSYHSEASLNDSSLIQQIFAESIADLNMICGRNEKAITIPTKLNAEKKFTRKGTPYKLKMPHRLTLYDEQSHDERHHSLLETKEIYQTEITSDENHTATDTQCLVATVVAAAAAAAADVADEEVINEREIEMRSKINWKPRFGTPIKESFVKKIAHKCRQIENILLRPSFLILY